MPAHFAHYLFAEAVMERSFGSRFDELIREHPSYVALGAQGPDLFFHNRRSKPSGLHYGSALHRKRYGSFTAALLRELAAAEPDAPLASPFGLFTLSWASHAVLDRYCHPFINYFAGWGGASAAEPSTHAFFERIVDVLMLRRFRGLSPDAFDFAALIEREPEVPERLAGPIVAALRATFAQGRDDEHIERRVSNAFSDALGFYRHTNRVSVTELRRRLGRDSGRNTTGVDPDAVDPDAVGTDADPAVVDPAVLDPAARDRFRRQLSLLHPFWLPADIDFANERHAAWTHPCDAGRVYRDSLWDRYDAALREGVNVAQAVETAWNFGAAAWDSDGPPSGDAVHEALGDSDLSDTDARPSPCRKQHSHRLPLLDTMDRIIDRIIASREG
jgi:hypothetical protein